MEPDRLEQLLRTADAEMPTPRLPAALLARIQRRAHHRRIRRVGLTAAAAGITLFIGLSWPARPRLTPNSLGSVAPSAVDVAGLRLEADSRAAVVRRLLDIQKREAVLAACREVLAGPDPLLAAQLAVDQAAVVLVEQAERLTALNAPQPAAELYRRVLQLFPDTPSAAGARAGLKKLEREGELL